MPRRDFRQHRRLFRQYVLEALDDNPQASDDELQEMVQARAEEELGDSAGFNIIVWLPLIIELIKLLRTLRNPT